MNREIKFRGKRIKNGEWVYGDLLHKNSGRKVIMTNLHTWGDKPDDVEPYGEYITGNPNTIGQITGLKDKNGKEKYEGDIIECISCNGKPIRHYIKFCEERGYYAQYDKGTSAGELYECGPICQHYIDEIGKYVIGNIHDNPELLNKND